MVQSWDHDKAQGEPILTSLPWGQQPPNMPPTHTPPPAKPKRNGWKVATIVLAILALVAMGAALSSDGDATGAPTPTPSPQTPPANPAAPVAKPKTVTVTKNVVPQACLVALDKADQNVEAFTFITDWTQRFLSATGDLDIDGQNELLEELTASTESGRYSGIIPDYRAAARACRAAS